MNNVLVFTGSRDGGSSAHVLLLWILLQCIESDVDPLLSLLKM